MDDALNAEQAFFGCLILDQDLLEEALGYGFDETFFINKDLRDIWTLMVKADKDGISWDTVWLSDHGVSNDLLSLLMDKVVASATFVTYAEQVALRKAKTALDRQRVNDPDDLQALQNIIDKHHEMFAGTKALTVNEIAAEVSKEVLEDCSVADMELPWEKLNNHLGGLRRGKLIFIGGRPSHHKTNVAIGICNHNLKKGKTVLYCDYEMGTKVTLERFVAESEGIVGSEMSTKRDMFGKWLTDSMRESISDSIKDFSKKYGDKLHIATYPKLHEIKSLAKSTKADIVVVDHIQIFGNNEPIRSGESRPGHLNVLCAKLKKLSLELNITIICPSQINRNCEGPPKMSDFKESAGIEENGDILIGVWWPSKEGMNVNSRGETCGFNYYEVELAKNRGGPIGRDSLFVNPATGQIRGEAIPKEYYNQGGSDL